jgi:hypothetical protein
MARFRVHHYALIGALLGLLSTVRAHLFYSLYFSRHPLPGYTQSQLAWARLQGALPEIVLCAVVGAVVGTLVSRRIIAPLRVHHCALIGALLGLLPTFRSALLYSLHITHDPSRGYTQAQLAWAMLKSGIPEMVVSAALGAVVGILVSRRRRSTNLAADHRNFLLITGLAVTALPLWHAPQQLLYPSLGVAIAWVISRAMRWTSTGGILLLAGLVGVVAQTWHHAAAMVFYLMQWGNLGIALALLFGTAEALGPTLLVMGLSSPRHSKPDTDDPRSLRPLPQLAE